MRIKHLRWKYKNLSNLGRLNISPINALRLLGLLFDMAPSVSETVTTTIEQASNGVTTLNLKQDKPTEATKDVSSRLPYGADYR